MSYRSNISEPDYSNNSGDEITIINPYNFNNKLVTTDFLNSTLKEFGVDLEIKNLDLYQQSFTHKSYCEKNEDQIAEGCEMAEKPEGALPLMSGQNERLEFLGDSVISTIVAKYLFERFSDQNEGFMTRMRTKLVRAEALCERAKDLNFGEWILISRHVEDKCNGRTSLKILEDCFEAFMGAMFLDFNEVIADDVMFLNFNSGVGFQVCETFLINLIEEKVDFSELILKDTNYKDQLLRYFQQKEKYHPKYKEISVDGQGQDRIYTVGVLDSEGSVIVEGSGSSKKKAEQDASHRALIYLNVIKEDEE
jgi:ribonuclease III